MDINELKTNIETGLAKVEAELKTALDAHTLEVTNVGKASTAATAKVDELANQFKTLREDYLALAQKTATMPKTEDVKSLGQAFVLTPEFKAVAEGKLMRARAEVKNTIVNSSGTTFPVQNQAIIAGSSQILTLRNIVPTIPVTSNAVNSLREDTFTNAAAETAEGSVKPETTLTFTPYNVSISTVAHFLKVSNQLLADAPAIAMYIDTRLRYGVNERIERQLILGNGTAPNISGFTDAGNFVAYTPTAGDNLADAINRAKYARWAAGELVDTVVVNPADWAALERLREGAGTGMYLYGAPGASATLNPFGLNVVISAFMTAGSFLVGAMRTSAVIYEREGIVVDMGYVDDDFTRNLVTLRGEARLGLAVDRPAAFMFGAITA